VEAVLGVEQKGVEALGTPSRRRIDETHPPHVLGREKRDAPYLKRKENRKRSTTPKEQRKLGEKKPSDFLPGIKKHGQAAGRVWLPFFRRRCSH